MLRRNHRRSFHSKESFLMLLSIGNGWKMFLLVAETCLAQIICSTPFTHHFLFMTSVQILFGRYANIGAQKQTLCIHQKVRLLFLHWTSMASLDFPSRDFFTMRLSPYPRNSRITGEGVVLTYLRFIIFFGGDLIVNRP